MIMGFSRSGARCRCWCSRKIVVFLTPENIAEVLEKVSFLSTDGIWLTCILRALGAVPGRRGNQLEGLSEETTCFVSMRYFSQNDRFADFIVHEAATSSTTANVRRLVFLVHDTRVAVGDRLPKRETFAYACEAYSRVLELSSSRGQRKALLDEYAATSLTGTSAWMIMRCRHSCEAISRGTFEADIQKMFAQRRNPQPGRSDRDNE